MPSSGSASEFAEALSALTERLGFGEVRHLRHLSGGASKQTWAFQAGDAELVLRRNAGSFAELGTGIPLETEAALMILAAEAGVPSPAVVHVLETDDRLGVGFVMRRVDGETLGGRIVRSPNFGDTRPKLAFQCGEILARIHAIAGLDDLHLPLKPATTILDDLYAVRQLERWPRPVFELAFGWLRERCPDVARPTLVHGDFRNGNLIVSSEGVAAVLDWELAQLGDPMQDLGWLCTNSWRFGAIDQPVGGFGIREELFAGYESAGGEHVDPERVRFWEILGSLRWGVICTMSAMKFRDGDAITVELPMIARRASETELDLVNLLRSA